MFLSRNKTNNVYPCKPQFYYIKMGFKGVKIIYVCFRDAVQYICRSIWMNFHIAYILHIPTPRFGKQGNISRIFLVPDPMGLGITGLLTFHFSKPR